MSKDSLRRFAFENREIRGAWVSLDMSIENLLAKQNHYAPDVVRTLNECLAASVLLSAMIKFDGRLSLQARGEGVLKLLMAETWVDSQSNALTVRGIVRLATDKETDNKSAKTQNESQDDREIESTKEKNAASKTTQQNAPLTASDSSAVTASAYLNLAAMLGKGHLVVSIEPQQGKTYQSFVSLEHETLAQNLALYFQQSEQLDTYFHISSTHSRAVAFMLQRLPTDQVDQRAQAEAAEYWQHCMQLSRTLSDDELLKIDDETLLYRLFHQEELRLFDYQPLRFNCGCSKERTAAALKSVGQSEVMTMLKEMPNIEMCCQFCGQVYIFDFAEALQLFDAASSDQII